MTTTFKLKYKFVFFFWPFTLSADISEKKNYTKKKQKQDGRQGVSIVELTL